MLFNSLQFLVFFPTVVLVYFSLPHRFRWALLLAASYYFYMCWKAEYVVLIIASTLIDYFSAIAMSRCDSKLERRKYMALSACGNLGMLFGFKYANFAGESLRDLSAFLNVFPDIPTLEVLLPVGISFYTFQTLSYTIDVYNGHRQPQRHLGKFATYVAFFPQLVAGPIERSRHLLPQFDPVHRFDYAEVKTGLKLMLWGFFKKLVIADTVAIYVDAVYMDQGQRPGLSLLIASYLFAFQIYCDFSGYSDIAIGASRVLGFRLTENFNRPYFARSIAEFWQRWHITLSTWFRDYVFVPLSYGKTTRSFPYGNILITWILIGLWHGAAWNFVLWGAYQAVLIGGSRFSRRSFERMKRRIKGPAKPTEPAVAHPAKPWRKRLAAGASIVLTFHLTVVGLVLFRAGSLDAAMSILTRIATKLEWSPSAVLADLTPYEFFATCIPIAFLMIIEVRQGERTFVQYLGSRPFWSRLLMYLTLIFAIACLGVFDENEFIYFQF